MTARHALAEQERNARAALIAGLERLVAESESALFDAKIGRVVAVNVLNHRLTAVEDYQDIVIATCHAQAVTLFPRAQLDTAAS